MDNTDIWNNYNQKTSNDLTNPKPQTEYTIIMISVETEEILNNIDSKINMIADGGFCVGDKNFMTYIIRTIMQPDDIRDRLMKGYYSSELEIIVIKVDYRAISAIVQEPLKSHVKNTFNIK